MLLSQNYFLDPLMVRINNYHYQSFTKQKNKKRRKEKNKRKEEIIKLANVNNNLPTMPKISTE